MSTEGARLDAEKRRKRAREKERRAKEEERTGLTRKGRAVMDTIIEISQDLEDVVKGLLRTEDENKEREVMQELQQIRVKARKLREKIE